MKKEVLSLGTESSWIRKIPGSRRQSDSGAPRRPRTGPVRRYITVYSDRSFTFVTKTPPAALLIKKACGIETASGVPQRDKVATISKEDVRKIAEQKMPDLNCTDIDSAISMIAGTCRSMGVIVGD